MKFSIYLRFIPSLEFDALTWLPWNKLLLLFMLGVGLALEWFISPCTE
ncbi:hypothetical protein ACFSJQ_07885 [Vibrio olivae]